MVEIILHVYDKQTGKELKESLAFSSNTRTFSIITDKHEIIIDPITKQKKDTGITKLQKFIENIPNLKFKVLTNPPCNKNQCLWCKDCYNKVCDKIGRPNDKVV